MNLKGPLEVSTNFGLDSLEELSITEKEHAFKIIGND